MCTLGWAFLGRYLTKIMENNLYKYKALKAIGGFLAMAILGCSLVACGDKKDKKNEDAADQVADWLLVSQYLEQNKLDEAEAALHKIVEIEPENPMGYADLGLIYLKQGKHEEAEAQLVHALKLNAENPEYRLLLAEIYRQGGNREKAAHELDLILEKAPNNAKAAYMRSQLYAQGSEEGDVAKQEEFLEQTISMVPSNIVPLMEVAQLEVAEGKTDEALAHLEQLRPLLPQLEGDVATYYDQVQKELRQKKTDQAKVTLQQLYQLLKLTAEYTSGTEEISGPQGKVTGYPIFSTDQIRANVLKEGDDIMDLMRFSEITESTGIVQNAQTKISDAKLAITDFDGDGDIDIYYSFLPEGATASQHFLYQNELGTYTDALPQAGLNFSGKETAVAFSDYNNDGSMDLVVSMADKNMLFENHGDTTFGDVTEDTGISAGGNAQKILLADLDQEGDLDILMAQNGNNLFYRNNNDGSFTEQASKMGLSGAAGNTVDVDFADLDNDGDLDLLAIDANGTLHLYNNQRHAQFEDVAAAAGLKTLAGAGAAALADFDNDGMIDIFVAGNGGALYRNQGDGTFAPDAQAAKVFNKLKGTQPRDVAYLDFDNDGYMDLVVAGGKGVSLFHNTSKGGFEDVSKLLPANVKASFVVQIGDFNNDGDQDIFLAGPNGVQVVRNDTGNLNHYLQVHLVGLTYGNSKNNRMGIGAQVSLRAGDMYQLQTMTEPIMHFGLGHRSNVDILRIIWPNGVPQNILDPKSKEDFVEEQVLKGSCPFLFTWNGKEYAFQKDMMWRSALGMPLAVQGKDTLYAFADVSTEYLKIPGENLKPKDGKYSIKITEELWEAVYFDKASLIAVDHPSNVDVFVDERFKLPPFPGKDLFQVTQKNYPITAVTGEGHNVLNKLKAYDFDYVSDFELGKFQGLTKEHDLVLDLGPKATDKDLYLYLRGWVFPPDASINLSMTQTQKYQLQPPSLQVKNAKGEWITVIQDLGYPMGKDKMVIADLSGKFPTADRHVRIRTNMQIYWDQAFFDHGRGNAPVTMTNLKMLNASLDFRGYSRSYRKGGRYGPHWFEHENPTTGQKWRDLTGNYTRYGDVLPLLQDGDDEYIIANSGDEITMDFDATNLPDLPEGWTRDFLIYSEGWVKDGDLNTMHGQTVAPLPFHNMGHYPYGEEKHYPTDKDHQQYQKGYNTRKVSTDGFKNALKPDA